MPVELRRHPLNPLESLLERGVMPRTTKADFYRVEVPHGAPSVEQILASANALADDDDRKLLEHDGFAVRIQHGGQHGNHYECDFIRIDFEDIPLKAKRDGTTEYLDLDEDEGVGDQTAALYDSIYDVLVLERNRLGVTPTKFARYLEHIARLDSPVIISPVITPDGLRRLASMSTIRKLKMRIASVDRLNAVADENTSTASMIQLGQQFEAPQVEVTVGFGHKRGVLHKPSVRSLLRSLTDIARRQHSTVAKLEVQGTDNQNEYEKFDLLDNRMIEEEELQPDAHRDIPYSERKEFLQRSRTTRHQEIISMFDPRPE